VACKSWIGIGFRRQVVSSEPSGQLVRAASGSAVGRIGLEVVEVRLDDAAIALSRGEPDWSSYDKHVSDLASRAQRMLAVVAPFRDMEGGADPDITLEVVDSVCSRS